MLINVLVIYGQAQEFIYTLKLNLLLKRLLCTGVWHVARSIS